MGKLRCIFISWLILTSSFVYAQDNCIDLGTGINLSNEEYAFIDFMKNGNRWEIKGPDGHPWYKVYSMDTFKVVNGAYWTWDVNWNGKIDNEAHGDNWADTYISYYQSAIDQGALDEQGWPAEVPFTLYK
jgi:hypothetical protein